MRTHRQKNIKRYPYIIRIKTEYHKAGDMDVESLQVSTLVE
jgi:hypothetical protein